jgi:hypothetical protein
VIQLQHNLLKTLPQIGQNQMLNSKHVSNSVGLLYLSRSNDFNRHYESDNSHTIYLKKLPQFGLKQMIYWKHLLKIFHRAEITQLASWLA